MQSHNPFRHAAWRTFTPADGLASLYLNHADQDGDGFLWFATAGSGASRFDGEEFVTFNSNHGLCGDALMAVFCDQQQRLWFASLDGGACWYDGHAFHRHAELDRFDLSVTCIYQDRQQRLWFAGPRLLCYLEGDRVCDLLPEFVAQVGFPPGNCWGIVEDAAGHIWLGTQRLVHLDGDRFVACDLHHGPMREGFAFALDQDQQGGLWAGGPDEIARHDGHDWQTILEKPMGYVRTLRADRSARMWAGTSGNGAYCFAGDQTYHIGVADGLTYPAVNDIFETPDGLLWFCTWGGGVSCCDPQLLRLGQRPEADTEQGTELPRTAADGLTVVGGRTGASTNVFDLCQDQTQRLWMASALDLLYWDGDGVQRVGFTEGLGCDLSMVVDGQNNLWIRSNHWDGLLQWDGHSLKPAALGAADTDVTALAIDQQGRLLVGLRRTDRAEVSIGRLDGNHLQILFCLPVQDQNERLAHIAASRDGICWFAVGDFAARKWIGHLATDGTVHWTSGPGNEVDAPQLDKLWKLLEDRLGRLWAATWSGLFCLQDGKWHSMLADAGLPMDNACCFCLYEDRQGDLWVGTEFGGLRYDGSRFQLVSSPHIKGPIRSILQDHESHMWFATADGTVRYTPTQVQPRVRLLRVDADRTYEDVAQLEVPVASGQVIFAYRGFSFRTHPQKMLYSYRLQGVDKDWQFSRAQRAAYADLPDGEYLFQVRAIDADLNESEPVSLPLTVIPDPRIEGYVQALSEGGLCDDFVGESMALRNVQRQLAEIARTDLTVLILGETGTGKGLAARSLHTLSEGRDGPFIQVNCGALPEALVESELFGHEKGAFTSAVSRKLGKVELARHGTLFLDEIGDMPLAAQVKLLRLLEERTFERIGGTQTLTATTRVVAATNRDLERMVADGAFREDLYYRLQVFPVRLPALRERQEDIELLAAYFAERMGTHLRKEVAAIEPQALAALQARPWPGNIRELAHVVQRAVIVSQGPELSIHDLGLSSVDVGSGPVEEMMAPVDYERRYLRRLLEKTDGVIKGPQGAAARLGVAPSTLRSRLKKLGIERTSQDR
jgi:DNA-binding NtrC family response regulator/ligand-binding sensor domain-containing protein